MLVITYFPSLLLKYYLLIRRNHIYGLKMSCSEIWDHFLRFWVILFFILFSNLKVLHIKGQQENQLINCFGYWNLLKFILRSSKCFIFASLFSVTVQIRRASVKGLIYSIYFQYNAFTMVRVIRGKRKVPMSISWFITNGKIYSRMDQVKFAEDSF